MDFTAQFEEKVQLDTVSGCYLWKGGVCGNGYGNVYIGKGICRSAHRVAYEIYISKIPVGMNVLHRCDIPLCVNPAHLFLGTFADNSKDMAEKERAAKGSNNGNSKLTEKKVQLIKKYLHLGQTCESIALKFSVCSATVWHIRQRLTWRHVNV